MRWLFILAGGLGSLTVGITNANATCSCVLTVVDLNGQFQIAGLIKDLSNTIPQTAATATATACRSACQASLNSADWAKWMCDAGYLNGTPVQAVSRGSVPAVQSYIVVKPRAPLVKTPETNTTVTKCPPTWYGDNNQLGGPVTGRCKQLAGYLTLQPFPTPGTQIGNWGFTWYHEVWAYGTAANGGAAVTVTVTTPAVCKF